MTRSQSLSSYSFYVKYTLFWHSAMTCQHRVWCNIHKVHIVGIIHQSYTYKAMHCISTLLNILIRHIIHIDELRDFMVVMENLLCCTCIYDEKMTRTLWRSMIFLILLKPTLRGFEWCGNLAQVNLTIWQWNTNN